MIKNIERYLGRPWVAAGFNCFELVREVYRNELGIHIPPAGVDATLPHVIAHAFQSHPLRASFKKIEVPINLSVVAMRDRHSQCESHCGIFIDVSGVPSVLHNSRGVGVLLEPLTRLAWRNLIISGYYEYK